MERFLMRDLVAWKESKRRKPLILNGARQVGKTWLLKEFGKTHFEDVAYISLDTNSDARALFEADFNVKRLIDGLSLLSGVRIKPSTTLLVLDEIQSAPKAITSLKYFYEDSPEYAIAAAGSLLGISAIEGTGYPVGKVNSLDLYPLSFREFLDATDERMLRELLDEGDAATVNAFKDRAALALKRYCIIGGMPAVVDEYAMTGDYGAARRLQDQILKTMSEILRSIFRCGSIPGREKCGLRFRPIFPMRIRSLSSGGFVRVLERRILKNASFGLRAQA